MTRDEASYTIRKFYADGYKSKDYTRLEKALQTAVIALETEQTIIDKACDYLERALPLGPDDRDEFIEQFKEAMTQ